MRTAADILADLGIQVRSTAPGRAYARCPQCSDTRKPAHRRLRCLGVTIDATGVGWKCMHCGYKGGRYYDDQRPAHTLARRPGDRPGVRISFRAAYGR